MSDLSPEYIQPIIEGYYRLPAIWIGIEPQHGGVIPLIPQVHHEFVYERTLSCNIDVKVRRDGLFLFDFSRWMLGLSQITPSYMREINKKIPKEVTIAENLAEEVAITRSQVMNVHQACMSTADKIVLRMSRNAGYPVNSANTIKLWSFSENIDYSDDTEDIRQLAMNVMNNSYRIRRHYPLSRAVIEMAVVDKSFDLLDDILSRGNVQINNIIELIYIAEFRKTEKLYSEAVVIAWAACEKLLNTIWDKYLEEKQEIINGNNRINKDRKKLLTGRDYTASIIAETLELSGKISLQLYDKLTEVRRSRNKWAHSLANLSRQDADKATAIAQEMIQFVHSIPLQISFTSRGGVPGMPTVMYKANYGDLP